VGSVVAAPPAAWWWTSPSALTWAVLLLMGVFATVGQVTLTRAYAHAPAASVGPFLYAGPVFAGLLDWLIWGRLPDVLFVAGAAVVILSATVALRIEGTRAPARSTADPSSPA
jgi:drug/metabolite transporter (DMT)-like permease